MPVIKLKMADVQSGFRNIPTGRYQCKLVDVQDTNSAAGNAMYVFAWEVVEGEHKEHQLKSYAVHEGDNPSQLKDHLLALGFKDDDEVSVNTDKLLGKVCLLDVVLKTVDSRKNPGTTVEVNQVAAVLPFKKKAKPAPVDDDEADLASDFDEE